MTRLERAFTLPAKPLPTLRCPDCNRTVKGIVPLARHREREHGVPFTLRPPPDNCEPTPIPQRGRYRLRLPRGAHQALRGKADNR